MLKALLTRMWRIENIAYKVEQTADTVFTSLLATCAVDALIGYLLGVEAAIALAIGMGVVDFFQNTRGSRISQMCAGLSSLMAHCLVAWCVVASTAYLAGFPHWMYFGGVIHFPYCRVPLAAFGLALSLIVYGSLSRHFLTFATKQFGYDVGWRGDRSFGLI